jgi:putative NADPH-quinone reductase
LLVQGHPDPAAHHLCHALADAYAAGAEEAGHEIRRLNVAHMDFPLLRSQTEWAHGALLPAMKDAQLALARAQHIVFFFPLWLGDMPALLKGFLEQVARPGFAFHKDGAIPFANKVLAGRSARVVVTMGMPALMYRWYFRAHSVKSLERNILGFVGIGPVHETLIGEVDHLTEAIAKKWLEKLRALGRAGQ